jgi:DNA-binding YbaB/EbfC family protein
MNMQALLRQAQQMQKDMLKAKEEIDNKEFIGKSSIVTVYLKGTKQIEKIEINEELSEIDDKDLLSDMIVSAINDAMKQIDKETEEKMGKYSKGMPGLF